MFKPRMFLGLNTFVYKNVCSVTKDEVLYPVGSVIVIHNFKFKTQRYINLPNSGKCISVIAVSSKGKYLAVAEKGYTGEKPKIYVYDLETLKRKSILNIPFEISAEEIIRLTFTHDSNYIAALTGGSDYIMYYYNWKKSKIESQTRGNNPPSVPGPVLDMAINPKDATIAVFVGVSLFRLVSMSENVWRQYGFQKAQNFTIMSVCWLTDDRVLAGCKNGKVMIIQSGDLNGIYDINEIAIIHIITSTGSKKDQLRTLSRSFSKQLSEKQIIVKREQCDIKCCTSVPTGFLYSSNPGEVVYFMKTSKTSYKKSTTFRIKKDISNTETAMYNINTISTCVDGETILCTTSLSQIYWVPLQDCNTFIEFNIFEEPLHHGPIVGLSTCLWKHIFMTCGRFDNSVRIWNYLESKLLLNQMFIEAVLSISLHPTGLYALIGFSDKVRYFLILIQELQIYREFDIPHCHILEFSNNGHLFAAECNHDILVYSSITFQNIANFKAHSQEISSLQWSYNDQLLYSSSINGAYYEWNIEKNTRIADVVLQNVNVVGLVFLHDSQTTICIGFDGNIITIHNATVLSSHKLNHDNATSFNCVTALQKKECKIVLGGKNGAIIVLNYPIEEEPKFEVFLMHNRPLTEFHVLQEGKLFVSTDTDGNICIWNISETDSSELQEPTDKFFTEILINIDELHNKNFKLKHLSSRISEMEAEHSFEIKRQESAYSCRIDELEEIHTNQIRALKERIKALEKEHSMELNKIHLDIIQMKQTHTSHMDQIDSSFNGKLLYEFQKYDNLKQEMKTLRDNYERKLNELQRTKDREIEDQKSKFETQICNVNQQLTETKNIYSREKEPAEQLISMLKENFETKLNDQKNNYESYIKQRDVTNSSLRAELGIVKKKLAMIENGREELKAAQVAFQTELESMKLKYKDSVDPMNNVKNEKNNMEEQLEKQKRYNTKLKEKIKKLKTANEDLDNEISKLEMALKNKCDQVLGKDEEIFKLIARIKHETRVKLKMEAEFIQLHGNLRSKETVLKNKTIKIQDLTTHVNNMTHDLHALQDHLQTYEELKYKVKKLCNQYVR